MRLAVGQYMVSTVQYMLRCWCYIGAGGGWELRCLSGGVPQSVRGGHGHVCLCCFFPSCKDAASCCLLGCTWDCWVLYVALFPPHRCTLGASCRCWLLGALLVCFRSVLSTCSSTPAAPSTNGSYSGFCSVHQRAVRTPHFLADEHQAVHPPNACTSQRNNQQPKDRLLAQDTDGPWR